MAQASAKMFRNSQRNVSDLLHPTAGKKQNSRRPEGDGCLP
jgi:hypothetical protein